jgi:hypothetical protein
VPERLTLPHDLIPFFGTKLSMIFSELNCSHQKAASIRRWKWPSLFRGIPFAARRTHVAVQCSAKPEVDAAPLRGFCGSGLDG